LIGHGPVNPAPKTVALLCARPNVTTMLAQSLARWRLEVARLLDAPPSRPPTVGIAVKGGDQGTGKCHA
jgi:hypothetical protein